MSPFPIPDYVECEPISDWHADVSIQLGELIECGFVDWDAESWAWDAYDAAQKARFEKKFNRRYFFREISITPPGAWKMLLLEKLDEVMPKYKPVYKALADGADLFSEFDEHGKRRNIDYDFPQTALDESNEDYAATGYDHVYETVRVGDWMQKIAQLKSYNDVDAMLLDECQPLFSCLASVSFNAR